MMDSGTHTNTCPKCENVIVINQSWTPGGMNDYGGFILKCEQCGEVIDVYVGRDIQMSEVKSGAIELASYDKDVKGSREHARKQHGLVPTPT